MQKLEILQDWIRVENCEVEAGEVRTYEFHVVQDEACGRITLTIKCLDAENRTVRLDPTVLTETRKPYPELAERRVRRLYQLGLF